MKAKKKKRLNLCLESSRFPQISSVCFCIIAILVSRCSAIAASTQYTGQVVFNALLTRSLSTNYLESQTVKSILIPKFSETMGILTKVEITTTVNGTISGIISNTTSDPIQLISYGWASSVYANNELLWDSSDYGFVGSFGPHEALPLSGPVNGESHLIVTNNSASPGLADFVGQDYIGIDYTCYLAASAFDYFHSTNHGGVWAMTNAAVVDLQVSYEYKISDLQPEALTWNNSQGGVDFSYSVIGDPLSVPATAKLFWANGTSVANILSSTPIFTQNIPAGFSGQATAHCNVAPLAAPAGSTYLLMILDFESVVQESNEANNTAALANVQFGVDVSHIQNEAAGIGWIAVKSAGKSFVFVKASEGQDSNENPTPGSQPDGTSYTDSNIQGATNAGLLVGVYHLALPARNTNATSEAINFLSRAGNFIGDGYLPPALDLESNYGLSRAALSQWTAQWLRDVEELTCVTPIIYTTRSVLRDSLDPGLVNSYPLWIAVSDPDAPVDVSGTPALGQASWPNWKFKQYQNEHNRGTCPGIVGPADLDSFHGSWSALLSLTKHPSGTKFFGVGGGVVQPPKNGQFQFDVSTCGQQQITQITIQASEDLKNWTNAVTLTVVNGKTSFTDSAIAGHPSKFYRVKP